MSNKRSMNTIMRIERQRYLDKCETDGGTAGGFRQWIRQRMEEEGDALFQIGALLDEAATGAWEAQPRTTGPDLFSINSLPVPEFLTRPGKSADDDGENDEDGYEKVSQRFATVSDLFEDAVVKMRKAAQASAAAEKRYQQAQEARRRARGNTMAFARDLADEPGR